MTSEGQPFRALLVGNWKMNRTVGESIHHVAEIIDELDGLPLDIILLPPAIAIPAVASTLRGTTLSVGAQTAHHADSGSFTGELSVTMLREAGAQLVLVGHSERRAQFGETDDIANLKVLAALRGGTRALVCVGETLSERDAGVGDRRILDQTRSALRGIDRDELHRVVIAYEPVWAVGTAQSLDPQQANATLHSLRRLVTEIYDEAAGRSVRLLYGGGLTAANAAAFIDQPDIDGVLVGAATGNAATFVALARALVTPQR